MRPAELAAIRAGDVDVAFRRWERPRVKVGTRMRTAVGLVEPRSASWALSAAQVLGANPSAGVSPGVSAVTESLPSYTVVDAPLPTA